MKTLTDEQWETAVAIIGEVADGPRACESDAEYSWYGPCPWCGASERERHGATCYTRIAQAWLDDLDAAHQATAAQRLKQRRDNMIVRLQNLYERMAQTACPFAPVTSCHIESADEGTSYFRHGYDCPFHFLLGDD